MKFGSNSRNIGLRITADKRKIRDFPKFAKRTSIIHKTLSEIGLRDGLKRKYKKIEVR